jgi:hypothetical protein
MTISFYPIVEDKRKDGTYRIKIELAKRGETALTRVLN